MLLNTQAQIVSLVPPGDRFPVMTLMKEVERGLPLAALDRMLQVLAPQDTAFAFRLIPRATLNRRRKAASQNAAAARLSVEEGSRVARIAVVWDLACDVWGDADKARAFLFRPHALLEGRLPIDVVLANEFGRPLVEDILGRLKYGSAA